MNACTFGTDAKFQASQERHNALYGPNPGQAIADAQRAAEAQPVRVPNTPAPLIRLASDKAVEYLVALAAKRTPAVATDAVRAWATSVDRALVSEKIDWLKGLPKAAAAPVADVPAGRYAVTGNEGQTVFVKVDRPTEGSYAGRTFVKVQAGSELYLQSAGTARTLLAKIEADGVQAACIRYGHELGECGRCGRTLTDQASREAGIGPVCAGKAW